MAFLFHCISIFCSTSPSSSSMENQPNFKYFCLFLILVTTATEAYAHPNGFDKLFVFGDSYVDTGNRNSSASSWHQPYGMTYPGRPAGHFSDGRVFSDFIASWIGIESPVPYRFRKRNSTQYGINFAVGGTGVFPTQVAPNETTQIDEFEQLLKEKVYNKDDLRSSVALVSAPSNDYSYYIEKGGSVWIRVNLERIRDLGVAKIAVMGLQPLGCLPRFTREYSYEKCNTTANVAAVLHNLLLDVVVEGLNAEGNESRVFKLDIYEAFMSAIDIRTVKFQDPLTPCCAGITSEYSCGDEENREKKYSVCDDPKSSFFWDVYHPTQAGWEAVYSVIRSSTKNPFQGDSWASF